MPERKAYPSLGLQRPLAVPLELFDVRCVPKAEVEQPSVRSKYNNTLMLGWVSQP